MAAGCQCSTSADMVRAHTPTGARSKRCARSRSRSRSRMRLPWARSCSAATVRAERWRNCVPGATRAGRPGCSSRTGRLAAAAVPGIPDPVPMEICPHDRAAGPAMCAAQPSGPKVADRTAHHRPPCADHRRRSASARNNEAGLQVCHADQRSQGSVRIAGGPEVNYLWPMSCRRCAEACTTASASGAVRTRRSLLSAPCVPELSAPGNATAIRSRRERTAGIRERRV